MMELTNKKRVRYLMGMLYPPLLLYRITNNSGKHSFHYSDPFYSINYCDCSKDEWELEILGDNRRGGYNMPIRG